MSDITQIPLHIETGDPTASEKLLPLVYDELRRLASQRLMQERPGQTLQATALVHEAYLRLVSGHTSPNWNSRGHFFAAAAEAMRRILVEQARRKRSLRHGGDIQQVELSASELGESANHENIVALSDAIEVLATKDRRGAEIVKLRFFAGFTTAEAAQALGISIATAENDWAYARSWLKLQLDTGGD